MGDGRRRRGSITASELFEQLERDEGYQRYLRDQERWRKKAREEFRRDAAGLMAELNALGYMFDSLDELQRPCDYRTAIPVLIRWLPLLSNDRVKLSVSRALTTPWARPQAARVLIDEFKRAPQRGSGDITWTIGNALSVVADDSVYQEIVDLALNSDHGRARGMLPLSFVHMKKHRSAAIDVALRLLSDDDVAVASVRFLKRVNATGATDALAPLLNHPSGIIRSEAQKALAKFGELAQKKSL